MAQRGRPAKITREQLAEVATEVGFQQFTLAEVARRLSVTLQTLYNHVRNRDELMLLGAETLEKRHVLPEDTGMDWLEWWRVAAPTLKQLYERTPGLATIAVSRPLLKVPPRSRTWEVRQRLAERSGFSPVMGLWANMTVHDFIFTWCARSEGINKPRHAKTTVRMDSSVDEPLFGRAAKIASSLPHDVRFAMNLEALLRGLWSIRHLQAEDLTKAASPGKRKRAPSRRKQRSRSTRRI